LRDRKKAAQAQQALEAARAPVELDDPYVAFAYNKGMGYVDSHDFMALNDGTSWERGSRSRTWWVILFWGLLDRVQVNTFILFKQRRKPQLLTHAEFYKRLTTQLYKIAKGQRSHERLNKLAIEPSPTSFASLYPIAHTPNFHCNQGEVVEIGSSSDSESAADTGLFPGHTMAKMKTKVNCFNCMKMKRGKPGPKRENRKTFRVNYPRTSYGCCKCKVALCSKHNCWVEYHQADYCGQTSQDPEFV
jgi:hypothetical protein